MSVKETWIAAEAISSLVGLPVVASPSGRLICNVNCAADPLHGKVPGDNAFNREALAHARLIAAAPNMREALDAFPLQERETDSDYAERVKQWWIAKAGPALAKTEPRK